MKTKLTLAILFFLPLTLFAQKAYIQVEAEPGISVFLDGTFKGKTNADMGGLIIDNIDAGIHTIKVLKTGFNPQEERVSVKPGEVYLYKVKPFVPRIKISESGNTGEQEIDLKVGTLIIQSLPLSINISITGLGINSTKSKDEWKAEKVPVGSYPATFKGKNKTLTYTIDIKQNKLTHLFVNMVSGKIEDRSPKTQNYASTSTQGHKLERILLQ